MDRHVAGLDRYVGLCLEKRAQRLPLSIEIRREGVDLTTRYMFRSFSRALLNCLRILESSSWVSTGT